VLSALPLRTRRAAITVLLGLTLGAVTAACGTSIAPTPATTPRATADPNTAQVTTAAEAFLDAEIASAQSGDIHAADRYTVPGGPAFAFAGNSAEITADLRRTFVPERINIAPPVSVVVSAPHAKVDLSYSLYGHEVEWPSLRAVEADHTRGPLSLQVELLRQGDTWLVYSFS